MTTDTPKPPKQKTDPRYAAMLYAPALPIPGIDSQIREMIEQEWKKIERKLLNDRCPACGQQIPDEDEDSDE